MARLLFFNVPGHGHVNPTLPLAQELARRGHTLAYFATPRFRAAIEATGARFEPYSAVGDDFFDPLISDGLVPMRVAHALVSSTAVMLPELIERARAFEPDGVVFDGMCPWGYFVARVIQRPAVASLSLMPPAPPALLLRDWGLLRAMLPLMVREVSRGVEANRLMRSLAARYGVPPLGPAALLNALGDQSISHTCAEFVPWAQSVPASVHYTGWTLADVPGDGEGLSAPPAGAGRPLVYISLGTINSRSPAFFRACFEAFGGSDLDVILSTGERVDPADLGAAPPNFTVRPWVAQSAVLRRAALFVTHGGMGSVHDGLYLGLPLLLAPQQEEQALTAQRAAALGTGLVLRKGETTAASLRSAAARLLGEPRFAAASRALGDCLRAAGGAPRAADVVERAVGDGGRARR